MRASVRQALDTGIDGLWVDNFSPWDSFGGHPLLKAFGEWSVAGFHSYLKTKFSVAQLRNMGIEDATQFDIRPYLQKRCLEWDGNPTNLNHKVWRDARWQDDPIWRAYLIYKRRTGTDALAKYYQVVKQEATAAGKPDFLVMGNDMPIFSLGWVRGDLDMVSTELNWGWHLTTGPRGIMPPPQGSYAPVYKLAREMARSRFVNAWMYVPEPQLNKTNIARVLYYQGLANHTFPMPFPGERTAGNSATDAEFFDFVRRTEPVFGNRTPVEEIGLFHSASSQLMEMLPGGFRDHAKQPHSFSFWGWGTALTQLHYCWRAVPEWKLAEILPSLRTLILPNAEVFDSNDAAILESWVRSGGTLILSGENGMRDGEPKNFEKAPTGSTLAKLLPAPGAGPVRSQSCGKGKVIQLPADIGMKFYLADKERESLLPQFSNALAEMPSSEIVSASPALPTTVGLTVYHAPGQMFIDVNNTRIEINTDTLTPTPELKFQAKLPASLKAKPLRARVLSPDNGVKVQLAQSADDKAEITLSPISVYASILLEEAKP